VARSTTSGRSISDNGIIAARGVGKLIAHWHLSGRRATLPRWNLERSSNPRHRFPADIISHVFSLRRRDVELILAERGVVGLAVIDAVNKQNARNLANCVLFLNCGQLATELTTSVLRAALRRAVTRIIISRWSGR
jgi:hypothetical protein